MSNFMKKTMGKLLALTLLLTCCFSNVQLASAASLSIIDSETGNGVWSFLSSNPNYLDSNLAASDEASKLVANGTYDAADGTHTIYTLGGSLNPTNLEYTYGDMKFIATANAAVNFRAFKGFGRVNLDPGAAISVPVKGNCAITVQMFVDANSISGSAGYTSTETGETTDGKITLYADGTEFASQTPIKLDKGSNQAYTFNYTGNKTAEIKIENTGSKILAIAGVTLKHVVQAAADATDCSEAENFPFSGNVYVVGDSTVCEYTSENTEKYNFRQGWAMRLGDYFAQDVNIHNLALSGRSSRSFLTEANYTTLTNSLKTGDYLLIQWGHNDEKTSDYINPAPDSKDPDKYTGIYSVPVSKIGNGSLDWTKSEDGFLDDGNGNKIPCFEWFLYNKYIKPARDAGAQPILITPVTRRDSSGSAKAEEKHEIYSQAIRQLAADYKIPMVDLLYDSQNYWNAVYKESGAEGTQALHALNSSGAVDNTHLSQVGASIASKMVATSIKRLGLALGTKCTVEPEKVTEITVDANALQTNVSTMTFKTIRDAMKFINSCNTPSSEEERVTLNFKKGTYREQIFVKAPYLTFKNTESEDYKDVLITWYYGIGYKYYSIGEDGFYSKDKLKENRANDTYTAPCTNWGHTIRIENTATAFKADNITFESSFNRYVTKEEIEDGCVPVDITNEAEKTVFYKDANAKNGSKPDRAALGVGSTKVQEKAYRERSCAFFILADKAEMNGCYFVSEQDTLGTNHMRQYYKNCVIEGTVDYICGTGNSIFDNCELRWGTTANTSGGYVSAPKGNYLFYNCKVTGNGSDTTNAWARPWGGQAANATMFKTVITKNNNNKLNIAGSGYSDMSKNKASEAKFFEYGSVDESGNPIDVSSRLKNTLQPFGTVVTDSWLMLEFNPYNYTTGKYGIENTENVRYTVDDWDPMNRAERMAPILEAINFDLSKDNESIAYNSSNNLYEVAAQTATLPAVAEGYERKVVSNSTSVAVSEDGNTLTFTVPEKGADAVSATVDVYYREKDSDEWGDKRTISLKLTSELSTTESSSESTTEATTYGKGDFDGNGKVEINDAAAVLNYVLNSADPAFESYTDANFNAAKVTGSKYITAKDAAEILEKVINPDYVFSGK